MNGQYESGSLDSSADMLQGPIQMLNPASSTQLLSASPTKSKTLGLDSLMQRASGVLEKHSCWLEMSMAFKISLSPASILASQLIFFRLHTQHINNQDK